MSMFWFFKPAFSVERQKVISMESTTEQLCYPESRKNFVIKHSITNIVSLSFVACWIMDDFGWVRCINLTPISKEWPSLRQYKNTWCSWQSWWMTFLQLPRSNSFKKCFEIFLDLWMFSWHSNVRMFECSKIRTKVRHSNKKKFETGSRRSKNTNTNRQDIRKVKICRIFFGSQ